MNNRQEAKGALVKALKVYGDTLIELRDTPDLPRISKTLNLLILTTGELLNSVGYLLGEDQPPESKK